jgi:universal stress protein A
MTAGIYARLLIAIDTAHPDKRIGRRASELIRDRGARLTLLAVIEPMPPDMIAAPTALGAPAGLIDYTDIDRNRLEQARRQLEDYAAAVLPPGVEIVAEIGAATDTILEVAGKRGVDLIIVGSHGRRGIRRLMGSTASSIVHLAGCDVLVVRLTDG